MQATEGQLSAGLTKTDLKDAPVQRDLGLLISNLNWTENSEIRIQKATGVFFQRKRNISNKGASQQIYKPTQYMLSQSLRNARKRGMPVRQTYRNSNHFR